MDDPEGTDPILARWFDRATRRTRTMLTDRTSRRRFVRRLGGLMVGAGAWTLLPVSRAFGADDAVAANIRGSVTRNWYCIRRNGTPKQRGWTTDRDPVQIATNVDAGRGDVVEVCVAGTAREVPRGHRFASVFYNRVRGVVGIELEYRGARARYAPTQMISDNLSFERVRDRFLEQHGASESDFANAGHLWVFPARQYLVGAGDDSAHARQGLGRRGIHAENAGVGMGTAQGLGPQHSGQGEIRGVLGAAPDLVRAVHTGRWLSNDAQIGHETSNPAGSLADGAYSTTDSALGHTTSKPAARNPG